MPLNIWLNRIVFVLGLVTSIGALSLYLAFKVFGLVPGAAVEWRAFALLASVGLGTSLGLLLIALSIVIDLLGQILDVLQTQKK